MMAHEVTMTFEEDGKWVVMPSVYKGVELSRPATWKKYKAGDIKAFGIFDSADAAQAFRDYILFFPLQINDHEGSTRILCDGDF